MFYVDCVYALLHILLDCDFRDTLSHQRAKNVLRSNPFSSVTEDQFLGLLKCVIYSPISPHSSPEVIYPSQPIDLKGQSPLLPSHWIHHLQCSGRDSFNGRQKTQSGAKKPKCYPNINADCPDIHIGATFKLNSNEPPWNLHGSQGHGCAFQLLNRYLPNIYEFARFHIYLS